MAVQTVTVDQLKGLGDKIGQDAARLPLRQALAACRVALVAATKENFVAGRAPDGTAWRPLAHARVRGGNKPLRDTGLLMASVSARNASGNVEVITDTRLDWGTNLDRAVLHQYGGTVRPKKGKYLAIPLTRQALRAGSPRNMPGLEPRIGPRGGVMVKPGRQGDVAHFALSRGVKVPARPFLGWNNALADRCAEIIADYLARHIAGA